MAESILQKMLVLGELLDLPTFTHVCRTFVDLYKIGSDDAGHDIVAWSPAWRAKLDHHPQRHRRADRNPSA